MVEGNFKDSGEWKSAKILVKHADGSFDVDYSGDYIEWKLPISRLRPLSAPRASAQAPEGEGEEKRRHRHRHHRHRRGEGDAGEGEEGGEKKHHHRRRHHRHK